jgi:hypothetical protein
VLVFLFLNACAFDIVHVKQIPTDIEPTNDSIAKFTLGKETIISLGTGYRRRLKTNTHWTLVGTIPQGNVFKTKDQILTVEASNIYEAYIVVESDKLTGFYLPAEQTYSPLNEPLSLHVIRQ